MLFPVLTRTHLLQDKNVSKQSAEIVNMRCHNRSIVETARPSSRSNKIVWTILQDSERYEKAKGSERPKNLSTADKRILLRQAYKEEKSAEQRRQKLELRITKEAYNKSCVRLSLLIIRSLEEL